MNDVVHMPAPTVDTIERLFDDIHEFTLRYVGWTDEFRAGAVAFAIASYIFRQFQNFPYLQFVGAHGFGKSTAAEVMAALCFRSDVFQVATSSNLYRSAHKGGTLIIDEQSERPSPAALSVLRGGFNHLGKVKRSKGEKSNYDMQIFNTYGCPY